jgi:hypothetical protein
LSILDKARRFLGERRYAYRTTFKGPVAEIVLKDLATFCHAQASTFHPNDRAHVLAEGHREVWLRISAHLNLSEAECWKLFDGRQDVSQ